MIGLVKHLIASFDAFSLTVYNLIEWNRFEYLSISFLEFNGNQKILSTKVPVNTFVCSLSNSYSYISCLHLKHLIYIFNCFRTIWLQILKQILVYCYKRYTIFKGLCDKILFSISYLCTSSTCKVCFVYAFASSFAKFLNSSCLLPQCLFGMW